MRSVRKEGHVPDWSALCSDSRISEKSRRILRSYEDRPARDKDKALSIKRGLERFRQLRGIATVGQHIYDSLEGEKVETDELLEDLRDSIASIQSRVDVKAEMHHTGKGNNSLKLVKDILYGKVKKFIPTGFKGFDEKNGGFLTGSLVVIAANSGGGKSALANQLAKNVAEHAMSDVCIIPLEMTAGQMWCRTFGILTGLDVHNIQQKKITRDERHLIIRKYTKWAKKLKKNETRHTVWAPEEDMGIEEMLYILKPFKYEMIIIDYIGLLKGADGDDQVKELGRIARFAKVYAKNTGTTVVLLAQLSDEGAVKYARAIKVTVDAGVDEITCDMAGTGLVEGDSTGSETKVAETTVEISPTSGSATLTVGGATVASPIRGSQLDIEQTLDETDRVLFSSVRNSLPQQEIGVSGTVKGIDFDYNTYEWYRRIVRGGTSATAPTLTPASGTLTYNYTSTSNIPTGVVPYKFQITVPSIYWEREQQPALSYVDDYNNSRCSCGEQKLHRHQQQSSFNRNRHPLDQCSRATANSYGCLHCCYSNQQSR
jgi:hypothetical protein